MADRTPEERADRRHDIEVTLDGELLDVLAAVHLNAGPDAGLTQVACTRRSTHE